MKRRWSGVIAALIGATVGLGSVEAAQSSSPARGAQGAEQGRPAAPSAPGQVTLTGCLQDAPAPGVPGERPDASADAKSFVLTDAKMGSGGQTDKGAVGTSGSSASRFELDGDQKTLSGHIDHQVEVTGTLQADPPPSGAAAGSPAARTGSRTAAPKLKVASVTMIAARCN